MRTYFRCATALLGVAALMLTSWGQPFHSNAQTAEAKGKPRVAFLIANTSNLRWTLHDLPTFKKRLQQLYPGVVVDAQVALMDPDRQLGQADSELAKGAKVLVVVPAN